MPASHLCHFLLCGQGILTFGSQQLARVLRTCFTEEIRQERWAYEHQEDSPRLGSQHFHLTKRHHQRLLDILNNIPWTWKWILVNTWHKALGELQSMSLALPGSWGLCSALHQVQQEMHPSCKCGPQLLGQLLVDGWDPTQSPHTNP